MTKRNSFKRLAAAVCTIAVIAGGSAECFAAKMPDKTIIYVSPSGNDNNSGDEASPFKTPLRARNYLRELKKSGQMGKDGAVVYFREGDYANTSSFELTAEDSGTESAPICYRSYPGETVRMLGGIAVDESKFTPVTDESVIAKIGDANVAKNILQVKLSDLGVNEIPPIRLVGNFNYLVEEFLEYNGYPTEKPPQGIEIFMNGQSLTNARYPNEGNIYTDVVKEPGLDGCNEWCDDENKVILSTYVPPEERSLETMRVPTFTISDSSHLAKWQNAEGALVYGKFGFLWADQSIALKSVDLKEKTMTLAWPSMYTVREGMPMYIYNLLEELDAPGEYYIDRDKMILYAYPPEHSGKLDITMSLLLDPLIKLTDCEYVTIKGMDIGMTRGNAVTISGGSHNLIDSCNVYYTADKAVLISGTYNGITNSHVYNVEGGVTISGGDTPSLTSGYNYIENCEVNDFTRFQKTYLVGIQLYGVGNRVTNCSLHGGEHSSMGYVGQYNTVEYCELYDLANQASDMGAFYSGMYFLSRGNRIMYNYVHDIQSPAGDVKAFYFDDGNSGDYLFGNVFKNIKGAGIHFTGRDLTADNNIFINCERAVFMDYRNSGESGMHHFMSTNWSRYEYFDSPLWLQHFPELAGARTEALTEEGFHKNNSICNNVLVNSGDIYIHSNMPKTWGVSENNYKTETDPGFYDAEHDNYLLKPDSIVYQKIPEFKPIPFTRIGLYGDRARERVKDAIVLAIGEPRSMVNGEVDYIDKETDARPFIKNNKTYIPLRFIAEALGGEVSYDDETRDIKIAAGNNELKLNLDKNEALKNGEAITLENAPEVVDGRTYLPLREMFELLEREVFWDDDGVIVVSDRADLLDSTVDKKIISYLKNEISVY